MGKPSDQPKLRREAAALARAYCDGRLRLESFLQAYGTATDPLIQKLVSLIRSEPDRTGYFTLSPWWLENRERVLETIRELEA